MHAGILQKPIEKPNTRIHLMLFWIHTTMNKASFASNICLPSTLHIPQIVHLSLRRFNLYRSFSSKTLLHQCVTGSLSENWSLFAPHGEEKALHLAAFGQIHNNSQTSTTPSCLL